MKLKFILLIPAFWALSPVLAPAQGLPPRAYDLPSLRAQLTSYIQDQVKKNHVKGLSLAVVDGSNLVWCGGYGWADEKNKVPATGDTLYMAGGISKVLTALEVMKRVELKKLKLDKPVQAYLPDFSIHDRFSRPRPITLRSLLAHHSGLPAAYLKGMLSPKPMGLAELVSDLREDSLVAPPQTQFRFSYLDYDLLGRILETQGNAEFPEVMRRDLLEPLGMESSTFDVTLEMENKLAKGYLRGKVMPLSRMRDLPVSGMASTANDLSQFMRAILGGRTVSGKPWIMEKTVASMFEPQWPGMPIDLGQKVGLGWMLSGWEVPGAEQVAWHEGSLSPYCSEMAVLYQQKLGVALLSNSSEAKKAARDIVTGALKMLIQAKFGTAENTGETKKAAPKEIKIKPEALAPYTGFYSAFGQVTPMEQHGTHLSMRLFNANIDLVPVGENLFMPRVKYLLFFHYDFPEFMVRFRTLEDRRLAVLDGFSVPVAFERIDPVPVPPAWDSVLGEYALDNPDDLVTVSNVDLSVKRGVLTASLKFSNKPYDVKNYKYDMAFTPLSENEAVVPGLFLTDGGTLRVTREKGRTRLFYSGYWFTKIK